MADIKTTGNTDASFKQMMTYSELNQAIHIEEYHALWNRFSKEQKD
jgi:hypothetical protein